LILDGIDEVVDQAEKGEAYILTSSITRIEVLECNLPPGAEGKYLKFLRREIVQEFDVDPRIARAAHDIRAFYQKKGHTLSVADSIHIATACMRNAEELFTLEGTGKNPKMTALTGRIADRWDLTICTPRASMGRLFTLRATDAQKREMTPDGEVNETLPSVPTELPPQSKALPPMEKTDDKEA
jgi:predicted nucleic acid-binding protein